MIFSLQNIVQMEILFGLGGQAVQHMMPAMI